MFCVLKIGEAQGWEAVTRWILAADAESAAVQAQLAGDEWLAHQLRAPERAWPPGEHHIGPDVVVLVGPFAGPDLR